jgi:hypothetical protein
MPWRDCHYPAETSLLAQSYLARDLVERFFNKIKHCRQIANALRQVAAQLAGLYQTSFD